jgi:protein phosphatase-4 regulatory subunit 3
MLSCSSLGALRVIRSIVGAKDEFYNRYIISNHLMDPVVALLLRFAEKYNLVNSATLELFEFIKKVCRGEPKAREHETHL